MKKNYTIEINRFVAILIIMGHHLYRTGAENYHFAMGWVFVEFFFILTGYFTAKHLCKSKENNTIKYTFTKFKKIIGLTCIAILCEYALEFFMLYYDIGVYDLKIIREFFKDLPFELLLIGSSYTAPKLVPVWYLSALFIVFPLFCLLFQIKHKEVRYTF